MLTKNSTCATAVVGNQALSAKHPAITNAATDVLIIGLRLHEAWGMAVYIGARDFARALETMQSKRESYVLLPAIRRST